MAKNRSHLYMMTKKTFYNKLHTHTIQLIFFRGRDFIELPEGLFFLILRSHLVYERFNRRRCGWNFPLSHQL